MEKKYSDIITKFIQPNMASLAESIKFLIYEKDPKLFELLNFEEDAIFLEPLLFSYFNSKDKRFPLAQILFGYIKESLRPKDIEVWADNNGIIYLPQIGYFKTELRNTFLKLSCSGSVEDFIFSKGNVNINTIKESSIILPDLNVEIYQHNNVLYSEIFPGLSETGSLSGLMDKHSAHLWKAKDIIKKYFPFYFDLIKKVGRGIMIFDSENQFSFGAMRAQGVAFLNTRKANNEVFFVEDLVHQFGHVIFNIVTADKTEFFAIDISNMSLGDLTNDENDKNKELYGSFHGLFTETSINMCFDILLENKVFSNEKLHELYGRFSDDMKRFKKALEKLNYPHIYTSSGLELYHLFNEQYDRIYQKWEDIIHGYNTSNQGYIFDYNKFVELNPLPYKNEAFS